MSVSRPPAMARASPAHIDRSGTSSRPAPSAEGSPTVTVIAESLCQPLRIAPQSMEMLSPSTSARFGFGMPCTISLLIDAQIVPVKPWYPRKLGTAPCERMWSSATASSSPVLTPGRTAAFTALIAPAVTRPEARMSSISCGVLIWIMRPLHFASSGMRARIPVPPAARTAWRCLVSARLRTVRPAESGQGPGGDFLDLADRIDPREQPFPLVEPRQRRGLFPVDLQAVPDGLGLVVVALHPFAVDEHAATGEPADQLVLVDDELQDPVEHLSEVGQRGTQLLGLRDGAREAVQQETGLRVGLGQAVAHH